MVAQAGWLDRVNVVKKWQSRNRVETLLITGNFGRSRVLAALVQNKRKHPMILVSPESNGQDRLYFMPTRPEAREIPQSEFLSFIEFLHPKRVIVIGDDSYVPRRYLDMLRTNQIATIVVSNEDWNKNAEALAHIVDYKNLPKDYITYIAKLEMAQAGAVPSDGRAASAPMPPMAAPASAGPAEMVPADDAMILPPVVEQ
jgi:hypothetical protein